MFRAVRLSPASLTPTRHAGRATAPFHRPAAGVAGRYGLHSVEGEPLPAPVYTGELAMEASLTADVGVVVTQGTLSLDLLGTFVAIVTLRVMGEERDELRTRFMRGRYEVEGDQVAFLSDDHRPLGAARFGDSWLEVPIAAAGTGEQRTFRFVRPAIPGSR